MCFGEQPFARGNLDAGRLSWLLGREVIALDDPFDPCDYDAMLQLDVARARAPLYSQSSYTTRKQAIMINEPNRECARGIPE